MGRSEIPPLRALPRIFLPGADLSRAVELPAAEIDKLRKVLRLGEGDQIAVLPNDGSLVRCEFRSRMAHPISTEWPNTESPVELTIAQALPKGDRLDDIVRSCTEIGVWHFVLFAAERSVVRWDEKKLAEKLRRYETIAREAAEQSFRCRLPSISFVANLKTVLAQHPGAVVLSEVEGVADWFSPTDEPQTVVIGPEGGWAPRELALIGDSGVTVGPRVLRVDTAAISAASLVLLSKPVDNL